MEEKIIRTQIFANKQVLNETSEQPIDVDFTLPEYYPDIAKILKCCCTARISAKGINGNTVTSEGIATVTAIYLDGDNMLNSYEYQYPFSKNFNGADISSSACLCVTAKTDYINCRAVTARKIDIHGAISITAVVTEKEPTEIISDVALDDIEVLRKTVAANTPVSCNEKMLNIEDEIEIGAGQKDINCLLRYDGTVTLGENKLIGSKTMAKGELSLNLLYCNDDGEIASIKESLPFSQMIETDISGDNCGIDVNATLALLEIKPKSDAEGKTRSFSVNAKILICVDAYCNNEIEAVLDAYSRKYETKITKKDVTFTRVTENLNETFTVKQAVDLGINISKVIDLWQSAKINSSKITDNEYSLTGSITASFIVNDSDNVPAYFEKEIPFDFSYALSGENDNIYIEPTVTVGANSYNIMGENSIEYRAEINLSAAVFECEQVKALTDITVDYEKPAVRPENCAMAVYFANSGESLWDIASKYLADIEEIKTINGVESEVLKEDKMLLVPIF